MSTVTFSSQGWLWPAVGLFLLGFVLILWSYFTSGARPGVRITCALLKTLGLMALLACLLEPVWTSQRAKPGANLFVLAADNSQGMLIKDLAQTRSRGELLRDLLTSQDATWQTSLEDNFQVRRYLVDSRPQAVRDFTELRLDGRSSALSSSLRTLAERLKGQPWAGVLLFSDGNATDADGAALDWQGLPPIYPVVCGEDTPIKDLSIQKLTVTQTAFEDAPVAIQADVKSVGYGRQPVVAQLFETESSFEGPTNREPAGAARPVAEQVQQAKEDGELITFRFQTRPERSGVLFYKLRIAAKAELGQVDNPSLSSEATLANNQRTLVVDRGQGPYRVLLVSGRPNWEFKFLNRAVIEDTQIQLVGLIRLARREPKFVFKGRAGESSNPLYRGFDRKTEDTERYDQPVLVRLNTRDEHELRDGFPKTAEELYAYHAVILDDVEADFFKPEQRVLLQKFVSERGGGFLMLGGQESFHQGAYDRTPIGDMLPVYLEAGVIEQAPGDLYLNFTREGWLQPWLRLRSTENEESARLREIPPFQVLNPIRGIKPGATIMAQVTDSSGHSFPALVVQRFGNGRAGALMIGDLWRSGLRDEALQADLGKAWRQMVRWLVADVPNRIQLQAQEKHGEANPTLQLQVRVRDEKFQPMDDATVTVAVESVEPDATRREGAGGESATNLLARRVSLPAETAATEAGLHEATYVPRETGGYHAWAMVTNTAGAEVGHAEVGWTTDLAADEFRSLQPNRAWLENLAARTGGEVIESKHLNAFAQSLPHRKVPIMETFSVPLWHQPIVFLFALACFIAEWGLRRWKGLA